MKHAFFSVMLAILVIPFGVNLDTDEMAAGPCNPEVQDCP